MEANERVKDTQEKQELWSWGAGTEGQLGTGKLQDEHLPQLIHILPSLSLLSCGGAHVIALTHGKKVFTWGRGTSGQHGHGDKVNSLEPKSVEVLNNFNIVHVSARWNHSGFVSECGQLFICGDGSFGKLGLGDYMSQCSPEVNVSSISANGDHSAALSSDGHVYTWGRGFDGDPDVCCPNCVISHYSFKKVALGWNHALGLTDEGDVLMLGAAIMGFLTIIKRDLSTLSSPQASILFSIMDGSCRLDNSQSQAHIVVLFKCGLWDAGVEGDQDIVNVDVEGVLNVGVEGAPSIEGVLNVSVQELLV
ncbi:hypothetical protein R6Q59_004834 [Mikania micrantha]